MCGESCTKFITVQLSALVPADLYKSVVSYLLLPMDISITAY